MAHAEDGNHPWKHAPRRVGEAIAPWVYELAQRRMTSPGMMMDTRPEKVDPSIDFDHDHVGATRGRADACRVRQRRQPTLSRGSEVIERLQSRFGQWMLYVLNGAAFEWHH